MLAGKKIRLKGVFVVNQAEEIEPGAKRAPNAWQRFLQHAKDLPENRGRSYMDLIKYYGKNGPRHRDYMSWAGAQPLGGRGGALQEFSYVPVPPPLPPIPAGGYTKRIRKQPMPPPAPPIMYGPQRSGYLKRVRKQPMPPPAPPIMYGPQRSGYLKRVGRPPPLPLPPPPASSPPASPKPRKKARVPVTGGGSWNAFLKYAQTLPENQGVGYNKLRTLYGKKGSRHSEYLRWAMGL
jgi:hypothetical protein